MNTQRPKPRDPADAVSQMTRTIWSDRTLTAGLREAYARDAVAHRPAGFLSGAPAILRAEMALQHALPDHRRLLEDAIPASRADTVVAHRQIIDGTHLGDGPFGAPTGNRLALRAMAETVLRDGRVIEEWQILDTGAIARSGDATPQDMARDLIAAEGGPDAAPWPLTPVSDKAGPYTGTGNEAEPGARLADLLARVMEAELSVIASDWAPACELSYPGALRSHGQDAADRFWLPLRATFPRAVFDIHHVMGRADAEMAPRAAVRWSLWGRHEAAGPFGPPTGAEVYIMGLTHAEFGPDGLRREWTLFDEIAVWKQILLATG